MKFPNIISLYKYRAFNQYSLQMLINEIAWFAKPKTFNDPFDCGILLDNLKIKESVGVAIQDAYLKAGIDIASVAASDLEVSEADVKAYEIYREEIFEIFQNTGVLSLSEINTDILMWGHYSDSHRGFCIEYERSATNILGKEAQPVIYQNEIPSLSALDLKRGNEGIEKLWLTKASHWSYEKEWRVSTIEGDKVYQFPCKIKSITFGMNMNNENRYTIRRILELKDVLFYEAVKVDGKFKLEVKEELE